MLQTVVLEKTFDSHLDCKDIQPANPKGNQCWMFIERTDTEAEAPIVWPLDVKTQLTEKDLMLGNIEGERRRGKQRMRWFNSITDSMDMNLSKLQEMVEDRKAGYDTVHGVAKSWTQLSNWTTTIQRTLVLQIPCYFLYQERLALVFAAKISGTQLKFWSHWELGYRYVISD